jgi:Glycosyl hydrolases family 35
MIAAIAVVGALAKVSPATRMSRTSADMHALGDAANTAAAPAAQKSPAPKDNSLPVVPEVEIVQHGGYPELHVGGHPFFLNSATFFYYRISHDRWNAMLDRYRSLGVNTIDIYIPWNWHEPSEGEFDFDGHTNPRRDLRSLLRMIAAKNLKLIARPGPLILNEWRLGGYPEWLLQLPDYPANAKMDPLDILEGRYPPAAGLNARDAEASAKAWLDNPAHMKYARAWLEAVAHELAPYDSAAKLKAPIAKPAIDYSDPVSKSLLFVQLDDDLASGRTNTTGENFWRYAETLRAALRNAGVGAPAFINPTDMRVPAAGAPLAEPLGVMGQWYLYPTARANELEQPLTTNDAATIEFFAGELATQPAFPPSLIEYQAGWYAPADDDHAIESPPANTLLSARLFLAHGIHGLNNFAPQDTVTPAGYSVPWANQAYLWGAALDPNGRGQRRIDAFSRNIEFLHQWGPQLAASHKRADFGMVDPLGASAQTPLAPDDVRHISDGIEKIARLAQLDHLASEILDPEHQPVDQLLRDAMIMLPVFEAASGAPSPLSENAQHNLVEYVRRGGTLFVFPSRPAGAVIAELWKDAPPASTDASVLISSSIKFGKGRVLDSSKDIFAWIALASSYAENRAHQNAAFAMQSLEEIVQQAGIQQAVRVTGDPPSASDLVVTELVTNEGTQPLGVRTGGEAWISVTNLNADDTIEAPLDFLSPSSSSVTVPSARIALTVTVPPRESLLLPVAIPICAEVTEPGTCHDAIAAAGAEYLGAIRDGKVLELTFYAPSRAEIRLHLDHAASHINLQDSTLEPQWDQAKQELSVTIPRGASPTYLRQVRFQLAYQPHAPAIAHEAEPLPAEFGVAVTDTIRLPLGPTTFLAAYPPLIAVEDPKAARVVFEAHNPNHDRVSNLELVFTGAYRGSGEVTAPPRQTGVGDAMLKPSNVPPAGAKNSDADADGILHGDLELRVGKLRDHSQIAFVPIKNGTTTAYRYDLDGDDAKEWMLENTGLRLIVSPESGGRALALVDKVDGFDLFSSVGALRDNFSFTPNPSEVSPERAPGRYGLFNRAYDAEWSADGTNTALRLHYHAADIFPHGADIEKTIELDDIDAMHVSYRVSLSAENAPANSNSPPAAEAPEISASQPQSFVAVQSFPAFADGVRVTKMCWSHRAPDALAPNSPPATPEKSNVATTGKSKGATAAPSADAPAPNSTDAPKTPADAAANPDTCQDFAPGAAIIDLPADANHLELRTPGRPGVTLDWDTGALSIESKRYSALLRITYPAFAPGGELKSTIRFHVLPVE